MSDATCSVCGGPPRLAIGHDLPPMTTSSTGFCLCGACAVSSLFPAAQASRTPEALATVANTARAAVPKGRTGSATAEEEVAAELEKLMGPAPGSAESTVVDDAPTKPQAAVTERELMAAMDDLAGQRRQPTARATAPAPKKTTTRLTEEEVAAELEKLMASGSNAA